MFVNAKEMQAFQAFLSQLRSFLSAPLPWIVVVLHSRGGWLRGLVEEVARHRSDLQGRHLPPWAPTSRSGSRRPPTSPPYQHLDRPVG